MISDKKINSICNEVTRTLLSAYTTLPTINNGQTIIKQGVGFGDMTADTEIRADVILGSLMKASLLEGFPNATITVEGQPKKGNVETSRETDLWFCIDPIDGSLNYQNKGMTAGLPYSACITVLRKRANATFDDIIVAGIIDLRVGDLWMAWKDEGGGFRATCNAIPLQQEGMPQNANITHNVVIGELYYSENRTLLNQIFAGQNGWIRNSGSAAYEMALVASGQAIAFICDRQKQHELGAGFALVRGAGGLAMTMSGADLNQEPFTFNAKTGVILARNEGIASDILAQISIAAEAP